MTYEEFKRQAEKRLCEALLEQGQEYSVLGYENGIDLIPSHAGFIEDGVRYFWDGYQKENLFDSEIESLL